MGNFARLAISIGTAVLVAGCAGLQTPLGGPGTMPQSSAITPTRATVLRTAPASYQVLYRFGDGKHGSGHRGYDGVNPYGDLIDVNGTLYGTTQFGGGGCEGGCGTVYSMSTTGIRTIVSRFTNRPGGGANPIAGLLNLNGTLYGTTYDSGFGSGGQGGSVYSVTTSGTVKALYTFPGDSNGANPWAGLIVVKGALYGTTTAGGGNTSSCAFLYGCGTVYSMSTSGSEKVLYSFSSGDGGGAIPFGDLIDVNGKLYGTTEYGGNASCNQYGCGVVFSITTRGEEKALHTFGSGSDGAYPFAGLIDVNGVLYGTTSGGGTYGDGTVYSLTTAGTEKVLYSFAGGSDGAHPYASLIDAKGTLYGTTRDGGGTGCSGSGCGTIFSLSPDGSEAVLHSFGDSQHDGESPYAGLIDVNGTLYGTTAGGGASGCKAYRVNGCGTVFTLTL